MLPGRQTYLTSSRFHFPSCFIAVTYHVIRRAFTFVIIFHNVMCRGQNNCLCLQIWKLKLPEYLLDLRLNTPVAAVRWPHIDCELGAVETSFNVWTATSSVICTLSMLDILHVNIYFFFLKSSSRFHYEFCLKIAELTNLLTF